MSHIEAKAHRRSYPVRLGDRGRLVLPAELRRAAGLVEGDELVASIDHDGVRLVSRRELARAGRGAFAHLAQGRSIVDEFLADRRTEADREAAEVAEAAAQQTRAQR